MRYPTGCSWLTYKETADGDYCVYNPCLNEPLLFDEKEFYFLNRLDGTTDPYEIDIDRTPEEVDDFLKVLFELRFIRYGSVLEKAPGSLEVLVREFDMDHISREKVLLADCLLRLLWLPVLVFGIWFFLGHMYMVDGNETGSAMLLSAVLGAGAGMACHELAHVIAGMSMGAKVFGMGVGFTSFLPCAFVLMNMDKIRGKFKRMHIHLAGIEMNLLLTGLFLFLSCVIPKTGFIFFLAAIPNTLQALTNLLPWKGLDGMHWLSEAIGCSDFYEYAISVVKDQKKRRKLFHAGASGQVTLACCLVIFMLQTALPVYLLLSVVMYVL